MTKKPISINPTITIDECSKIMLKEHIGSLLIVEGGKLVGIIAEQDIVRKVVAKGLDPHNTKIKEIMVTNIITIDPDSDIYEAIVIMRDSNIRHLPVMHKKSMVGYLTIKDVLKIEPQLFELLVEKFEIREERNKPVFGEERMPGGICEICSNYANELYHLEGIMYCSSCKPKE